MAAWKEKNKIMQRYDVTAEMYDERYAEEQASKYKVALENLKVAETMILDVGCGSGLFFSYVAPHAKLVVGVDISRKLLIHAKERACPFQNIFLIQADADYLPFAKSSFDTVFAFTLLQNVPNPMETLKEFKRVTKQKGKFVVTGLKKAFTLDKFLDLLEAAGLTVVSFADDEDLKCYVVALSLDRTCTSTT